MYFITIIPNLHLPPCCSRWACSAAAARNSWTSAHRPVTDANFYKTTNRRHSGHQRGLQQLGRAGSTTTPCGASATYVGQLQHRRRRRRRRLSHQLDNFNIPATNPMISRLWGGCYVGIGRANLVLEKVPGHQI